MEVVANNYLPGDQRLVDKIVYELKAQGIFDQFRKECFADVDTKPAYQNLRQRVESNVAGFLKDQSWRPDMNKNQVREMLRKTITESGYLETGVERIVDQVVNPKINTVFLPKVEEVVYSYLGIKKPNSRNETVKSEPCDLLPHDLEAVSPESEPVDKKDDKSTDTFQDLDESKTEEDESPPFEPLEEQSAYVPHEENSVDSHLSGFSGLISHESNQSNENKVTPMEQDSQMSRNSSDSRLSIVTSDDNSKMEICEDSQSKSVKSGDSNSKQESDKNKHKTSDKHKSRSEIKYDKDRKSKDSKSRHSSSSKDKDKSRDRKDSKSTSNSNYNKSEKEKDKLKDKNDKDRGKGSSITNSKHSSGSSSSSNSKDKSVKKDSSKLDKDKNRSSSSHKESKPRDKSSDSRKEKSSSSDKHKHPSSSSSHRDKDKKDKDRKKDTKSKDDHYSSKDKKNDRRSTDRDSNDGQSGKHNFSLNTAENNTSQTQKTSQESSFGGGDSGNSDQTEHTTKAPVIITEVIQSAEVTISPPEPQRVKVLKPKCASNMQEALRLRKIRKQLAKLEKHNQLSLASVDVSSPILLSASINFDDLNCTNNEKVKQETLNSKIVSELEVVPSPLQNTVISQDNWDAMEAKLRAEVVSEFKEYNDDSLDDSTEDKSKVEEVEPPLQDKKNTEEVCKYFDSVDINQIEFLLFVEKIIKVVEEQIKVRKGQGCKRKADDNDLKNNNNRHLKVIPEKKARLVKKNKEKVNHVSANEKFPLPLSPAESDKSIDKKDDSVVTPIKPKRSLINKASNQRYSSDDLYKPRPTFTSSRRRGAKNLEN